MRESNFTPKVTLISHTPKMEQVVATAGRTCYSARDTEEILESFSEEKTEKMVKQLVNSGHTSATEHASFTFSIEGVSRALTHQFVRHRMGSYSQKSQRYVEIEELEYVVPTRIENNPYAKEKYEETIREIQRGYDEVTNALLWDLYVEEVGNLEARELCWGAEYGFTKPHSTETHEFFARALEEEDSKTYNRLLKVAIENARYLLPNATHTTIIVTMNARSLMNFFNLRMCRRAQEEIRVLATEMFKICYEVAPNLFSKSGAPCLHGKCPEGKMSCGRPVTMKEIMGGGIVD